MADLLTYRLPGTRQVKTFSGTFSLMQNSERPNGFVVTDFLHQNTWTFAQTADAFTAFHAAEEKPVVISRRDYQIEAQAMLNAFEVCNVEKAVYSRVKQVSYPLSRAEELFAKLEENYPDAFVYLISSAAFGTWVGATPEVLLDAAEGKLKTVALASTKAVAEQSEWTAKEFEEHAFVAEAVRETLRRNDCELLEKEGPFVVSAGPVKHLKTTFLAETGSVLPWKIAMDLHPTPAVCGTPRMAALDLLLSREMHDRKLYTGIIGIETENETRLFVNLRCAQLQDEKAYLYVGGGYTKDSVPDLEWEETENKAITLGRYMS